MPCKQGGTMIRGNDVARFWSKTSVGPNGCIDWTAGKDKDGYGKFVTGPRGQQAHHRAHRWLYEKSVGLIGDRILLHSCDRPSCVAIHHLSPGTQQQNITDGIAKGRIAARLNEAKVHEIRRRREAGESFASIAKSMGLTFSTVYGAAMRRTWKEVK